MRTLIRSTLALLITAVSAPTVRAEPLRVDILVYGGNAAGIVAGIQAKRLGKTVLVLEPGAHIGGLTTGGLGQTDIGNKQVIGGLARDFYRGIRAYYRDPAHWRWQTPEAYASDGQSKTSADEDTMWTFEPRAARVVLDNMIQSAGLEVRTGRRLDRVNGVAKKDGRLIALTMENGTIYEARVFIDATYEGDLLAAAGVSHTVGREANREHAETLNGVQARPWSPTLRGVGNISDETLATVQNWSHPLFVQHLLSFNSAGHQLHAGVDPYVIPGDASSGLLPGIDPAPLGEEGSADARVQAYNYRLTLTDHPDNRLPIEKPAGYDPLAYELLLRHLAKKSVGAIWINSPMPNRKTDTNNRGGFSTDWIGANHGWAEATYVEREAFAQRLRDYTLGLLWTLANNPRVDVALREKIAPWGLPRDEYPDNGHFSPQVYVREARRLRGEVVITQHHCEGLRAEPDIVGMAAYGMDSHHVRRYVDAAGHVRNEGNVQAHVIAPYGISYRALTPRRAEADNLLVPVCLSATHIAYGSIRMEPVFMVLGQSAATAAALALDGNIAVQDVPYASLQKQLLNDRQILSP